jgi:hypothetical protein
VGLSSQERNGYETRIDRRMCGEAKSERAGAREELTVCSRGRHAPLVVRLAVLLYVNGPDSTVDQ